VSAEKLGLDWLGIELNPDYVDLAWQRLGRSSPPDMRLAA
jgi:DNA modification methylase